MKIYSEVRSLVMRYLGTEVPRWISNFFSMFSTSTSQVASKAYLPTQSVHMAEAFMVGLCCVSVFTVRAGNSAVRMDQCIALD